MEFLNHHRNLSKRSTGTAAVEEKHHWPPWAIILLVACVLLSAIAFFIGNCINKRTSRTMKPATKNLVKQKRAWGAGFSGGLWAAA
ncbi:unnamed protein product, partial [Mesorhabditis spiculigera]